MLTRTVSGSMWKRFRIDQYDVSCPTIVDGMDTEVALTMELESMTHHETLREALLDAASYLNRTWATWEDDDGALVSGWSVYEPGSRACEELQLEAGTQHRTEIQLYAVYERPKIGKSGKVVGTIIEEIPLQLSLRRLEIAARHRITPEMHAPCLMMAQ